jgi:hypothetical protein
MNTKQLVSAHRGGHLAVLAFNESAAIEFRCRGNPRDGRSRPTTSVSGKCRLISFTDFKAARFQDGNLFSGAMTYTCVLTAERGPSAPDDTFSVVRFFLLRNERPSVVLRDRHPRR